MMREEIIANLLTRARKGPLSIAEAEQMTIGLERDEQLMILGMAYLDQGRGDEFFRKILLLPEPLQMNVIGRLLDATIMKQIRGNTVEDMADIVKELLEIRSGLEPTTVH